MGYREIAVYSALCAWISDVKYGFCMFRRWTCSCFTLHPPLVIWGRVFKKEKTRIFLLCLLICRSWNWRVSAGLRDELLELEKLGRIDMFRVCVITSPLNPRPPSDDSSPRSCRWESCPVLFNTLGNVCKLHAKFWLQRETDTFKQFIYPLNDPGLKISWIFGGGALCNKQHWEAKRKCLLKSFLTKMGNLFNFPFFLRKSFLFLFCCVWIRMSFLTPRKTPLNA